MSFNNLIVNGGFETSLLSPWTGLGAEVTAAFSHTGIFSVQLSGDTVNAFIAQSVPATPGQTFEFLASLAKIGPLPSPNVGIVITYFDSLSNFLGTGLNIIIPTGHLPDVTTEDWLTVYETTLPVPAEAAQALVVITKLAQPGTSDVVVDDVALLEEAGAEPAIAAFGGVFSVIPQTFTFTAASQVAQVALPTQMPSSNIVTGSNTIQISIPGFYELNFMIRIGPAATASTINAGVRLNGGTTFITSTLQSGILSPTDDTIFQGSVIAALGQGSVLDLALQSTEAATVDLSAGTNASLSAKLLAPAP